PSPPSCWRPRRRPSSRRSASTSTARRSSCRSPAGGVTRGTSVPLSSRWDGARLVDVLVEGVRQAVGLLLGGDREIITVLWLSLQVSGTATLIALLLGIPAGAVLALTRFPGRTLVVSAINTGMGLPPVVVGLFVTILLWRSGPLGDWEVLYTPAANVPAKFRLQLYALGASRRQMLGVVLREARLPMLAAIMAGFGGVISEIGASMMVGGNIKGQTRTLTTAMVLETGKGNFDVAIALSILLMVLVFGINWVLTTIQQRRAL